MALIDRSCTTYYWCFVVNIVQIFQFSSYLTLNNIVIRDLEIYVKGQSRSLEIIPLNLTAECVLQSP